MDIFYTVCMTMNAICALSIMFSGIQKRKSHFKALAVLNIVMLFFTYFTWQTHVTTSVDYALEMTRYASICIILSLPLLIFTFGGWLKFGYTKQLTTLFFVVSIPFFIFNLINESTLRYSGEVSLVRYESIFGEQVSLLIGEYHPMKLGFEFILIGNLIAMAILAYRSYRQRKQFVSLALGFLLIVQVINSYIAYKINILESDLVRMGGVPLTLFSVICLLLISAMYKRTNMRLQEEKERKEEIQSALKALAAEASNENNESFYHHTTENIQRLFETKAVFIGRYIPNESYGTIETLSVIYDGELRENLDYSLKDTPSYQVINGKRLAFEDNVAEKFPNSLFAELNIKAFVGLPVFDASSKPIGILALMHDEEYKVAEDLSSVLDIYAERIGAEISRDRLAQNLKQLAYFDYLTKLPNRVTLFEKINEKFKYNISNNSNSLLVLIDIDHFKEVNKIYGYDVADQILKEVGHRLKVYSAKHMFVARNEGDEFAILIDQLDGNVDSLIDIHWRAISSVISSPIHINNQDIIVECSAGTVLFPLQTNDRFSVIRYAESALQQAKHNGRNQCATFDMNIQADFERQQLILNEIRNAMLTKGELFMVYQPQTSADGSMVGAEALIRWISPEYGFISPGEFILVVEQTEIVHELGYWIIREVLGQMRSWKTEGHKIPAHISINVASKQLVHQDFVTRIVGLCEEFCIPPSHIVLELTESGILTDTGFAIDCLTKLKSHGFRIALDDFGTGYSSLSYLKDLPIDILKIDKSFIDDISSPSTKQLIHSMFSISQHLGLDIVAEGTESKSQIDELASMGCNCFQGYFYSKPLKSDELIQWQKEHS